MLVGLAAAGVLVSPQAAQAETQVQLDGRLSPVIREVPRQPPSMTLRMTARFIGDGPGFQPPILDHSVIRFPTARGSTTGSSPTAIPPSSTAAGRTSARRAR